MTHYGITAADIDRAIAAVAEALRETRAPAGGRARDQRRLTPARGSSATHRAPMPPANHGRPPIARSPEER